jgi:hypothetical protein
MPFGALKHEQAKLFGAQSVQLSVAKHLMPCGALKRAHAPHPGVSRNLEVDGFVAEHLMPFGALKFVAQNDGGLPGGQLNGRKAPNALRGTETCRCREGR